MKIAVDSIEAIALEVPVDVKRLRHDVLVAKGTEKTPTRDAVVVRIDSGGVRGEAYFTQLGHSAVEVARAIKATLTPLLIGQPAASIQDHWDRMFLATRPAYWSRPILTRAISVVDAALWDLAGKQAGSALVDLWGRRHDDLRVVTMSSPWPPEWADGDCVEAARSVAEEGFAGLKFKVGMFSALDVTGDANRACSLRDGMGSDFDLVPDGNQGWSFEEALDFAKRTEDLDLTWIEEPCSWESDVRDLARLRQATSTPLAAGQMEITPAGCETMIAAGAVDVCNFDAAIGGGPTAWRRVAAFAQDQGVAMAQHMEPQVALHLIGATENPTNVETYSSAADPFYRGLIMNPMTPTEGRIGIPSGPGWGFELDESFVQEYRVEY